MLIGTKILYLFNSNPLWRLMSMFGRFGATQS